MRITRSFSKILPAVFLAGVAAGVAIGTLSASFRGSTIFRDVPSTHYADDAIGEMYQLGIIKGLDSAHFGPYEPLTRGQAALLFKRLRDEIKGIASSSSRSTSSSRSSSSSSSVSSTSSSVSSASSSTSSYNAGGFVRFDSLTYNVDKNVATGQLQFLVMRIGGNTGAGTVEYALTDGTAVSGKDYEPISGTLTFGSKETSKKLTLTIKNNTAASGQRTANLTLKNPTGVLLLGTPATAVVNINDPFSTSSSSAGSTASSSSAAPTTAVLSLSATTYTVLEGQTLTVTVNRTGVTTSAVTVGYATSNATGLSGVDFVGASGTLSFAAGETTKTFTVTAVDNSTVDGNRTFGVVLVNPSTGTSLDQSVASVTLADKQTSTFADGTVKFGSSNYSVNVTAGKAVVTVSHVGGIGAASVAYSTTGGSALPGTDYSAVSGTLTFAPGESIKTFTVPILAGGTAGRVLNLSLSSPSGATLGDQSIASVTLQ